MIEETDNTIPPYILGLWTGNKYWWSSSVGITSINVNLVKEFLNFFRNFGFEDDRIKLSVYSVTGEIDRNLISEEFNIPIDNIKSYKFNKGKEKFFILYVNSRPLKRIFEMSEKNITKLITRENIFQFLAGVFDADGNIVKKKNRLRIGYTTKEEAEREAGLISYFIGNQPKVSFYHASNEWILEMCGKKWGYIIDKILYFSKR